MDLNCSMGEETTRIRQEESKNYFEIIIFEEFESFFDGLKFWGKRKT